MMAQLITEEIVEKSKPLGGNLEVRILRSVPELEEVRNIWTAWNHHPNSDIDLYLLLLETRPEILRPHIVVLYRGGAPVAMLIGRIVNQRMELKIGYKTILKPKVKLLSFVTGGTLGNLSPGNCKAAVSEIVNCLRQREADIVAFHNIRTHEPIYEAARRVPDFISRDRFVTPKGHWMVRLRNSYPEFLQGLSSKERNNIRRYSRRLVEAFGKDLAIRSLCNAADFDLIMKDTETVAAKTYHRGLGVGFIADDETRRLTKLALDRACYRSYILYINDHPRAFWNGFLYGKTFFTGTTGVDPEYSKYRLGIFLLTSVFQDLCRGKVAAEVDFGLGDAQYKQILGNRKWQDATIHIFGPTLTGLGVSLLRTPIVIADKIARRAIGQTGLLLRVKKTWRNRVRPDKNHQPSREQNSLTDPGKAF